MLKKIVVTFLSLSVLGAGGAAAVNQVVERPEEAEISVLADSAGTQSQGLIAGEDLGQPWSGQGTIVSTDDVGFWLRTENEGEVYVELGPPDFWQNQGLTLEAGQFVMVNGAINADAIHAYQVENTSGQQLVVRDGNGQPLWSGGVSNRSGGAAQSADGDHTPEPQAQVDEWVTIEGTLLAYQNGNMTISTAEGDLLTFKTGQPRFLAEQGVVFQTGDAVRLVGFYGDNGEFMAGEITQLSTGLRAMLRDPNGRPLWAGPGNGRGNGSGNGQTQ